MENIIEDRIRMEITLLDKVLRSNGGNVRTKTLVNVKGKKISDLSNKELKKELNELNQKSIESDKNFKEAKKKV